MGDDDDRTCVEHVWRLEHVEFRASGVTAGSWSEYRCSRCDAVLVVPPNGEHPATV